MTVSARPDREGAGAAEGKDSGPTTPGGKPRRQPRAAEATPNGPSNGLGRPN